MDIEARIRAFIGSNFYIPDMNQVSDETSLVEGGLIDSTGVLELITFLESDLGIDVEDADVVPENMDSIAHIARYVARKQAAAALGAGAAAG